MGGTNALLTDVNAVGGATSAENEALNNSTLDHESEFDKKREELKKQTDAAKAALGEATLVPKDGGVVVSSTNWVVAGAGAKGGVPSAMQQATNLFATNSAGSLRIGDAVFRELPNTGNAAIFSGVSDQQLQHYFLELTGLSSLPDAIPVTSRGFQGVRYTVETSAGNFNLRNVSSSQSQTDATWTIDIPANSIGVSSGREIKFLRGSSECKREFLPT